MAIIERREQASGKLSYRVRVRLKGYPPSARRLNASLTPRNGCRIPSRQSGKDAISSPSRPRSTRLRT